MPPPPPQEEGAPMSEMEELQYKINDTADASLDSTRRMLALCEESKEAGIKTLVALDDQGEQLDNIEKGMHLINEDMVEAEKAMNDMGKCCGLFTLPWNKQPEYKEDASIWKDSDGKKGGGERRQGVDATGVPTYGGYVAKITNDAREEEMEKNMDQVSTMIGNLRNMAIDMEGEINNQNAQLDRINLKAQSNDTRITQANERARGLLNK